MTDQESLKLDIISAYIGSPLTDEQKEFASNFLLDTISFSDPGTGKTHTLTAGLVMLQCYHHVDGRKVDCMSFTNAAVAELAARYQSLCKKLTIVPTIEFNTFHSLSNKIMKASYPRMTITAKGDPKMDIEDMQAYMESEELDNTDINYVRKVIKAINELNSSLTFHPDNVAQRFAFINLHMDLEKFQNLRRKWFTRGIVTNKIVQGDIPLYCLYALMTKPEIGSVWKGKYKVMVVDEFQDLSLLHLRILSVVANTLIVVGDMKQQIYAFNGACPQIVKEYFKLHPNARVCNLTQSFRCSQKIADFATAVIKPNDESIKPFTGHSNESSIEIVKRSNIDWEKISKDIDESRFKYGNSKMQDIMFLYRNNASALPIVEALYKKGIPFRCSRFTKVMDIPVFSTMTKLVNAAWHPTSKDEVKTALLLFDEFKKLSYGEDPGPVQAMEQTHLGIFDINYAYKNIESREILAAMKEAHDAIVRNVSAGSVYMKVFNVYQKYLYKKEIWMIDNPLQFYLGLAAHVCNNKPYPLMYNEEFDKEQQNAKYVAGNVGVRCYTMHTSKGLEADNVYILDCDEGVFPNAKIMDEKFKAGCYYDIAQDIHAERNLLYVAITRAKSNVTISYSGDVVTSLISNPSDNEYTKYDKYLEEQPEYDDATAFFNLFNIGG